MTEYHPRNDHRRPNAVALATAQQFSVAVFADAARGEGVLTGAIKPVGYGMRVVGPAYPCRCPPGDNLAVHAAIKLLRPGDVLVIDGAGAVDRAVLGDLIAIGAQRMGANGAVVDGAVRDVDTIAGLGFPLFARAITPRAGIKEVIGSLGEPIEIDGVPIAPGDLIVGDGDGVIAIPLTRLDAVLAACVAKLKLEGGVRAAIADGATTWDLQKLDALLTRAGGSIVWPAAAGEHLS